MDQRTSRLALYAAVVLAFLGLVVLYLGYDGTATNAQFVRQVPYLVSGGFTGVALFAAASAALVSSVLIRLHADTAERLQRLEDALLGGSKSTASEDGDSWVWASDGGTAYHREDCHQVDGKESLVSMTKMEATDAGLSPCRICKP